MLKKIFVGFSAVAAGMLMVFGGIYFVEKRKEEAMGGKLMRVNYKFTKEFED
ncbi:MULTISPECIES: hypothetical protein [Acetobacterium]|uniref:Stress-responsive transcriptional regulator PspC n=1 Tax=Acetobacterium malicum TaxID=52692 RepID=A0ABR6YWH4_9FIRM|nr:MULTISPECIES: hypothetical protein [Acetobacterium]MBC3899509.1 stress-responsive transcriptional regulator PspC [Acetobacterium malicum]MDO9491373.1 stress-responsive transcriptional regulator PspC [Acetobacterium sp.]